ncbi:MAG: 2-amino-4-hydroxy-6-hydroxymethyldihydropteridine diphosphokinase [Acidobacteriaceae bacterium]|nr:2-amino-4-hydroxy-6-hydroxymethyldihydropteridine diphosphokinase [Acidobacteriaceae bacterium]
MKTVFLSLGSNLGDREQHLETALAELEAAGVHIAGRSSIYETEPQEFRAQPWFLNMVIEVETKLFPMQLLGRILKIEKEIGRKRVQPKGPRVIDIDILLFGDFVVATPELTIPHPAMAQRRFVLEPLAELAPDFRHPVNRRTVRELMTDLGPQTVRKWTKKEPDAGRASG